MVATVKFGDGSLSAFLSLKLNVAESSAFTSGENFELGRFDCTEFIE
jgi:hypothetical protein